MIDEITSDVEDSASFDEPYIPQESLRAVFDNGGLLSQTLPNHQFRPQQLEIAEAVEEAFLRRMHALLEAATGTGKTFAYLIPAVRAIEKGKVVVISTDTHTLQSQLLDKDIPILMKMFPNAGIRPFLMKGRSNYACFGGETRVITKRGVRSIEELAFGGAAEILDGNGRWVLCAIESFGVQRLMRITLTRSGARKTIYATRDHRWFVQPNGNRPDSVETVTEDLRPGQHLAFGATRPIATSLRPSPFGIAHGIVFGDGTVFAPSSSGFRTATVVLHGDKATDLIKYFPLSEAKEIDLPDRYQIDRAVRICDLPAFFKARPDLSEAPSYLYGWLAGYFATDGTVDSTGRAVLTSARQDHLEFARDVCNLLGITTFSIRIQERVGIRSEEASTLYHMTIAADQLGDNFFIRPHHREHINRMTAKRRRVMRRWVVESVEWSDREEEVYCAVVPTTRSFVLEDNILTGNCHAEIAGMEGDIFTTQDGTWPQFQKWMNMTESGDKADLRITIKDDKGEVKHVPFARWSEAAAKRETCRRKLCPWREQCFYYRARDGAYSANLLIVNHSLFMADLQAKRITGSEGNFGEGVLPKYDYVIFDEAHHVVDKATEAFSVQMDLHRVEGIVKRLQRQIGQHQDLRGQIAENLLNALLNANADLFGFFKPRQNQESSSDRIYFHEAVSERDRPHVMPQVQYLLNLLNGLHAEVTQAAGRVGEQTAALLEGAAQAIESAIADIEVLFLYDEHEGVEADEEGNLPDEQHIRWAQIKLTKAAQSGKEAVYDITLCHSPIRPAEYLREMLWSRTPSCVLTSATLTTCSKGERHFRHFKGFLGLPFTEGALVERIVDSPFDYEKNAVFYVPGHLPEPPKGNDWAYTQAVVKEICKLTKLSGGRAFVLFTSRRMLESTKKNLPSDYPFPTFFQDDAPAGQLIADFRNSGNGVLFGVKSFWEGVDVQGDALSLVIIDKIPFGVPDDPLTNARISEIKNRGGNWFGEYSLPQAQIALKQGVGRLIRTVNDRGVIAVLDTRLRSKHYKTDLINSLPPAARAGTFESVVAKTRGWSGWSAVPA